MNYHLVHFDFDIHVCYSLMNIDLEYQDPKHRARNVTIWLKLRMRIELCYFFGGSSLVSEEKRIGNGMREECSKRSNAKINCSSLMGKSYNFFKVRVRENLYHFLNFLPL